MRKNFFTVFLMLLMSVAIYAQKGTMTLNGQPAEYQIETQYRIGPGAIYSKYRFNNIAPYGYKMVAHVIEIDQANQYVKQAPYLAEGKYLRANSQVTQYKNDIEAGKKPLASIMGNPFTQITTGTDYMPDWSVVGGLTIDNAICHAANGSALAYYVANGKTNVGNITMSMTATSKAGTINIGNINRVRSNSSLPTLFCNGFGMSREIKANEDKGCELILQLDKSTIGCGTTTAQVIRKIEGSFHEFVDGQAILSALDGEAFNYVNQLNVGDQITISVSCLDENSQSVALSQLASPLFGYAVKNGVAQSSKMAGYAQCAMGVSRDNSKAYWVDMDHDTDGESDAPVAVMNQFMQQLGIFNALLMDGGPSAEMQVGGLWVTKNSLGNFEGRAVPSAVMLYSTAPYDNTVYDVAVIEKEAYVKINVPFTPTFYAYNRYGDMVSASNANYYLEFNGTCGKVSDDGKSFIPTGPGEGDLSVCISGTSNKSTMRVVVSEVAGVTLKPQKFYSSEGRDTQATLYVNYNDGSEMALDNSQVTWTSSDEWIVTCDNGCIKPHQGEENVPGEAVVTATYEGMSDKCDVTVVNVDYDRLDLTPFINDQEEINYVLAGTPKAVVFNITAKKEGMTYFVFYNGQGSRVSERVGACHKDETRDYTYKFEYDNTGTYPVTIAYVNAANGRDENFYKLNSMVVYYGDVIDGIQSPNDNSLQVSVKREADGDIRVKVDDIAGMDVHCDVYTLDGKLVNTVTSTVNEFVVPVSGYVKAPVVVLVKLDGKKYIYKIS